LPNPNVRIGTSGYTYSWNKAKPTPFRWYVQQGFNSVEINYSFYRFPSSSSINVWQNDSPINFTFSIKVHRSITHYNKLKQPRSTELWDDFLRIFEPIEDRIDFWLFQMPASFKFNPENLERVKSFFKSENIIQRIVTSKKAVIEFRDASWWDKSSLKEIEKTGIAFCSIDAPSLPNEMVASNDILYLRLHGSEAWYSYVYSEEALNKIVARITSSMAHKKAIYLNNDHGMLTNGLFLIKRLYSN
jgi:uncharacterized protein YecE (DUF72 family)